MNNNNSFGQKLKSLRKLQGLTLKKLANKTGITESFVSYLEKGTRNPSKDVALKLAKILLPVDDRNAIDDLLISANLLPTNIDFFQARKDLINVYEEKIKHNKKDYRTYTLFIMALLKAGKLELAQDQIQKGFDLFKDSVQLQALLSHLELIKGNYESAIVNINAAIENYKLKTEKQKKEMNLKLSDLILNLGIIYFIKGLKYSGNKFKAETEGNAALAEKEKNTAIKDLKEAKKIFEQALTISPDDIYLLDEYARVNFNLGYLEDTRESYWDKTLEAYSDVINSENNYELGNNELREACIFYAHALTKKGEYKEAEFLINIIGICNSDYWLVHYIKACLYSIKYNTLKDESFLDKALKHLKKAIDINDPYNRTHTEAMYDPELKNIRTYRKNEFFNIINYEKKGEKI